MMNCRVLSLDLSLVLYVPFCGKTLLWQRSNFAETAFEKAALAVVGYQSQSCFVTLSGFIIGSETTKHVRAGRVQKVIFVELARCDELVEQLECRS